MKIHILTTMSESLHRSLHTREGNIDAIPGSPAYQ